MRRYARISKRGILSIARSVEAYLPQNYSVVAEDEFSVIIGGVDASGWTLDDYVIPRLASGLIFAEEVDSSEVPLPDVS